MKKIVLKIAKYIISINNILSKVLIINP